MRHLLLAVLLTTLPTCALAAPPGALVRQVTERLNRDLLERGAHEAGDSTPAVAGGRVRRAPAAMFTRVDVNGDGAPDWRVNFERAPNPSFFCGSAGCRQDVYVSRPGGGYDLTLTETAGPMRITPDPAGARLWMNLHGTECNRSGAEPCPRTLRWNEGARRWDRVTPGDH